MNLIHTRDLDADFFSHLEQIAALLGSTPEKMIAVMFSESGCRADAWNDNPKNLPPEKRWNASGLIQFMPATLLGLGWKAGHAAFRALSATEQLPFVHRYYAPYVGHLGNVGGLYVATFLPALIRHAGDRDFVLTAKNGPLGWAYSPNAAFDANKDLAITVGELEDAVARNCRGPRWAELVVRLEGNDAPPAPAENEAFDLRTTLGLQEALDRLGFEPGPLDGLPGPKTQAAVAAFQSTNGGLDVDGIFGPKTRAALEIALTTRA